MQSVLRPLLCICKLTYVYERRCCNSAIIAWKPGGKLGQTPFLLLLLSWRRKKDKICIFSAWAQKPQCLFSHITSQNGYEYATARSFSCFPCSPYQVSIIQLIHNRASEKNPKNIYFQTSIQGEHVSNTVCVNLRAS